MPPRPVREAGSYRSKSVTIDEVKRRPAVSVLVPTYNRAALLGPCLQSLLNQTLAPAEVLVVNDGSTDGTAALLDALGPRVRIIETPQSGKPTALNVGLRHVEGEDVWIFDDDDVAAADALERLAAPLECDRGLGFSYGHFWYTPTRADGSLGTPTGVSLLPDVDARGFVACLLESNFLGGAALFARTSCYAAVGDFDPALVRSQDYEMAIRIARRFRGAQAAGGPLFHYRQHHGARGSEQDRFTMARRRAKWLEYDRLIFQRLYRELPLADYLPPGHNPQRHRRAALIHRAAVMAGRDLMQETLADLSQVADAADQSRLSAVEIRHRASRPRGRIVVRHRCQVECVGPAGARGAREALTGDGGSLPASGPEHPQRDRHRGQGVARVGPAHGCPALARERETRA